LGLSANTWRAGARLDHSAEFRPSALLTQQSTPPGELASQYRGRDDQPRADRQRSPSKIARSSNAATAGRKIPPFTAKGSTDNRPESKGQLSD